MMPIRSLRLALRSLARDPVFSGAVLFITALGIGAATTIFTLVDAVVLEGLPFEGADRMVRVTETYQPEVGPMERRAVSLPDFVDWRVGTTTFADLAIQTGAQVTLALADTDASVITVRFADPSLFLIAATRPSLGRLLEREDDDARVPVAVLSHDLWAGRMGADPSVIGRSLTVNEVPVRVVGVAEPEFGGVFGGVDLWMPYRSQIHVLAGRDADDLERRGYRGSVVFGRLRPGATIADAQRELDRVTAGLHEAGLLPTDRGALVVSLEADMLGPSRRIAGLLFVAAGLVLLIVVANVANLTLVRQRAREGDTVVRRALGASDRHVVGSLLVESIVLGAAGGALGVPAAIALVDVLADGVLAGTPTYVTPSVDGAALLFALLVALVCTIGFGLVPALRASSMSLGAQLRSTGRGRARASGSRRALVGAQVAVAVVLVLAAGLMVRSVEAILDIDPGLDATGVVIGQIALPDRYDRDGQLEMVRGVRERLESTPGVRSVGVASDAPLVSGYSAIMVRRDDRPETDEERIRVYRHHVSPGYLRTLGMRLISGRDFTEEDVVGSEPVVMVSRTMAERHWPDGDPLGARLSGATIVGVVGDVRYRGLAPDLAESPDDPDVFFPLLQDPTPALSVAVRISPGSTLAEGALREAVAAQDPGIAVFGVVRMDDVVREQTTAQRAVTIQLGFFGLIALALAAAGIYGVLAHSVGTRTHEIGVRMALGATPPSVLGLVFRQGLALVAGGVAVGLLVAGLATGWLLDDQLYGVQPGDPATLMTVIAVFGAVGAAAALLPAWRAIRVDPVQALRQER